MRRPDREAQLRTRFQVDCALRASCCALQTYDERRKAKEAEREAREAEEREAAAKEEEERQVRLCLGHLLAGQGIASPHGLQGKSYVAQLRLSLVVRRHLVVVAMGALPRCCCEAKGCQRCTIMLMLTT